MKPCYKLTRSYNCLTYLLLAMSFIRRVANELEVTAVANSIMIAEMQSDVPTQRRDRKLAWESKVCDDDDNNNFAHFTFITLLHVH